MNSAEKLAAAALLIFSVAGCSQKKTKVTPVPQAQAPSKDAGTAGALFPPPLTSTQSQPQQSDGPPPIAKIDTPPPPLPPQPKPKKPIAGKKAKVSPAKPGPPATPGATDGADPSASTAAAPAAAPSATQTQADQEVAAASGEPAAASPIGTLSTGRPAGQSQTYRETFDLIGSTENSVNAIKRALTPQEQETVTQIKTFLQKAHKALDNQDYDGANTLATKAKVLLDELNKD
jgi:hypothetical protein